MMEPFTILVVDDSRGLRSTVCAVLRSAGHRVLSAATAKEALQIIDLHAVDLVFTDILMPEMDGLALIREIRRRVPFLPIVGMSGGGYFLSQEYCLHTAKIFGATAVLAKPFDAHQLLAALDQAIAQPSAP
ncbi:MAG TPA: response regulator [Opitutaceae bacterium]|nr:response regulator [Opitutaceae bacterium]